LAAAGQSHSAGATAPIANSNDAFASARAAMTRQVSKRASPGLRASKSFKTVLAAINTVPRHLFVPADQVANAYQDRPLPIGLDQTISDPYVVAVMTTEARLKRGDHVLEVGTGSGYQAAILSSLGVKTWTIEILEPLAKQAEHTLRQIGYTDIYARSGDGYFGWPDAAPFDAIIVTAGAKAIPPALVEQLRVGGRIIIPTGPNWAQQDLMVGTKRKDGTLSLKNLGWVLFVPFTRK
jgi:protein-L-isoaspartate(D-aspartate) O-methyltransferase